MNGSIRRLGAALAVAAASVGSMGIVAVATGTPSGATPCTGDTWTNAAGGSWSTAGDWSAGVPTSTTNVCITTPGTYTVDISSSATAANLQLGGATSGTQTLEVDGTSTSNTLTLDGAATVDAGGILSQVVSNNGFSQITGSGAPSLTVASGGEWSTSGTSSN